MSNPHFWLALAGITAFGLLWIRFCGWLAVKLMEWMEGESEGPVPAGPQVKQAKKGA